MAFPNIKEIKNLKNSEIQFRILELKKDILNIKLKQATRQKIKSHLLKYKKHELAQLLTLETQQKLLN